MKKKMFAVLMAAAMAGTMAMTVSAAGEKIALITMVPSISTGSA